MKIEIGAMEWELRDHVIYLLPGGGAHLSVDKALADLPEDLRASKVEGVSHTPWRLLEHMRIAQWDILNFARDPSHISPSFPEGYWPLSDGPSDSAAWDRSWQAFRTDLQAMIDLVADSKPTFFARIPHGDGQTMLREALLMPTILVNWSSFDDVSVPGRLSFSARSSWSRSLVGLVE